MGGTGERSGVSQIFFYVFGVPLNVLKATDFKGWLLARVGGLIDAKVHVMRDHIVAGRAQDGVVLISLVCEAHQHHGARQFIDEMVEETRKRGKTTPPRAASVSSAIYNKKTTKHGLIPE